MTADCFNKIGHTILNRKNTSNELLSASLLFFTAVICVYLGWVGYAGADDFHYINAAMNGHDGSQHWGFRWPYVKLLSFLFLLGHHEIISIAPNLAAFGLVAWLIYCLSDRLFENQHRSASALIFCSLPICAIFASFPCATTFAANLASAGTLLFLTKEKSRRLMGCALLAMSFAAHEMTFFYVAILCFASLLIDSNRHWKFVLATIAMSFTAFAGEAIYNHFTWNQAMIRWDVAAQESLNSDTKFTDWRVAGGTVGFFLWPLRILVLEKNFGIFLLGLSFSVGVFRWKHLNKNMKILLLSGIGLWFWTGYGTIVPWDYKPRSRAFHYYLGLALHVSIFIPQISEYLNTNNWRRFAIGLIGLNVILIGLSGSWHQRIETSKQILQITNQNLNKSFVADEYTLRELTFLNGGKQPSNVQQINAQHTSVPDFIILHQDRTDLVPPESFFNWVNENKHGVAFTVKPNLRPLFQITKTITPRTSPFTNSNGAVIFEAQQPDPASQKN